ncbi:MAG: glycosyltransferase, partial [Clostridia bacterium]|nr:glycosyltransferase [Clostridia bacterium]
MAIKLSIGTAIYNIDEDFLRANIEGTIKQLTDETELLLIDDCSTNNSGEVCREYAAKYDHVRYVNMGKNGGLSRVRNRTIDEAAGKWICFADGDDLFSDNFVETALRFCDTDYDIIIHERLKFTETKPDDQPCTVTELTELPPNAGRELSISCMCLDPNVAKDLALSSRAFYHAAWGALYKKDFLLKKDLRFPEGQKKAQDSVFNTEAYFCAEKIAYLPHIMYYYRSNL